MLFRSFAERRDNTCTQFRHAGVDKSNQRHRRLLRARRKRPCRRHATEQRDEVATFQLITSSAATSNLSGTVRPSILAFRALMTNSNFDDCMIGKSEGFAPLRMRPV